MPAVAAAEQVPPEEQRIGVEVRDQETGAYDGGLTAWTGDNLPLVKG